MTMKIRHLLAALAILLALPARAIEYTDLWWNPAESGWGLTVTHQGNVTFLAFFVFGTDGKATWYSSPAEFTQRDSVLNPIYIGPLFASTGPFYGAAFNPDGVKVSNVGRATFAVTSPTTANLGYTVNGVLVTKSLIRQTFKLNGDVVGNYTGGMVVLDEGCGTVPRPAPRARQANTLAVIFGPTAATNITVGDDDKSCTTTGAYAQVGRLGHLDGNITCTDGRTGTASFHEIEANRSGFKVNYSLNFSNTCSETGYIVATRRNGSP
jgi:hypothetical protein